MTVRLGATVFIKQFLKGCDYYTCHLLRTIQKADPQNRFLLRSVYPDTVEAFERWERIRMSTAFLPEVGSVVKAGKVFMNVTPGMKGVVYERYDRTGFDDNDDDNTGVSIIFESGDYDGFSRFDLDHLNIGHTGILDHRLRYYRFENVGVLTEDFRRGMFNHALKAD